MSECDIPIESATPDECDNCRFSLDTRDTVGGKRVLMCRAKPPTIPHKDTRFGAWPSVSSRAWCGMHERVACGAAIE